MLNADKFALAKNIYIDEFIKVLNLMIDSYFRIRSNEILNPNQMETFLRNVLVKKYLRIYKKDFGIGYLSFEVEPGEVLINCKTVGFIDIKVSNIGHKNLLDEDEYFAFECKRLDGNSTLNSEYINQGIYRFVDGKYSSMMPLAGMIGFVQKGCIANIVDDLNKRVKNHASINTIAILTRYQITDSFNDSYYSVHERNKISSPINLYHLIFDYT